MIFVFVLCRRCRGGDVVISYSVVLRAPALSVFCGSQVAIER